MDDTSNIENMINNKNEEYKTMKGSTYYLNFKISSSVYSKHNLNIWGYVNEHSSVIKQGWISKNLPDFIWKQFQMEGKWEGVSDINSDIDSTQVYKIYEQSFKSDNQILSLH